MCAAYGDLVDDPIQLDRGEAEKARIAAALVALSSVPSWPAGDEARDALIAWYQNESEAAELYDPEDPLPGIQKEIEGFDLLGQVGHALDALETATGEGLPCRTE